MSCGELQCWQMAPCQLHSGPAGQPLAPLVESMAEIQPQKGGGREKLMRLIPPTSSDAWRLRCPSGTDRNEWIIIHAFHSYNNCLKVAQLLSKECVCQQAEYNWSEGGQNGLRKGKPPNEYTALVLAWVHSQLHDESVCPREGNPVPPNFLDSMKLIFRRLFRIYVHLCLRHHNLRTRCADDIKQYLAFVILAGDLLTKADLQPLAPIVREMEVHVLESMEQQAEYYSRVGLVVDIVWQCIAGTQWAHQQAQAISKLLEAKQYSQLESKTQEALEHVSELFGLLLDKAEESDGGRAVARMLNKPCTQGHRQLPPEFATWCAGKQYDLIARFFIAQAEDLFPRLKIAIHDISTTFSLVHSVDDIEEGTVMIKWGPPKTEARAIEKYKSEEGKKEISQIVMDYLRLTMVYPHLQRAVEGYEGIQNNPQFQEVYFKNKYLSDHTQQQMRRTIDLENKASLLPSPMPPESEHKTTLVSETDDKFPTEPCCLHAYFMFEDRMVVEIMFMTVDFVQAKDLQHKFYEVQRQLKLGKAEIDNPWKAQDEHGPSSEKLLKAAAIGFTAFVARRSKGDTLWIPVKLLANPDAVAFLIAAKANVNARNASGETALIFAASHGHSKVVELLLKAKADVRPTTTTGMTALQLAEAMKFFDIVRMLSPAV